MLMLSLDSSAITASACLTNDDEVLKSEFLNAGLTHSETLLPLVESVMEGYGYSELDAIAVNAGPGSFTGVRIGIATVKGLAFSFNTPCVAVSALHSVACNFLGENAVVCAVMDARRGQFYNALFEVRGNSVERLCPDRAISAEDLKKELGQFQSVIIAGDGAKLCYESVGLLNTVLADRDKIFQNAVGVSRAAKGKELISEKNLFPIYLRPSQAERELKLKREKK